MLFDVAVPLLTRRVVNVVAAAAEHGGYLGSWTFALAVTGIAGLAPHSTHQSFRSEHERFDRHVDEYRQSTTATLPELQQSPGAVTGRLVNRLLRALGVDQVHADFTTDETS